VVGRLCGTYCCQGDICSSITPSNIPVRVKELPPDRLGVCVPDILNHANATEEFPTCEVRACFQRRIQKYLSDARSATLFESVYVRKE
jgi:hypothetical protein